MMKTFRWVLAPIAALWLLPSCSSQAADFDLVGLEVARLLQNGHYARMPFDEELSERIFDDYLHDLDPSRLYFVQADIDEFSAKYRSEVTDLLITKKAIAMAREIHQRYQLRVKERVDALSGLLKDEKFTFDKDLAIMRDREDAPWPKDSDDANYQMKLQLEASLLSEQLRRDDIAERAKEQGKESPLSDELPAREKLAQRYDRFLQGIEKADEEDVANYFLSAVARSHDPHTEYFSARELEQFNVDISNKLVGIGALLRAEDDGATKIEGIVNNGPADKAGELQLGDRVIAVDSLNDGNWTDIMFLTIDKVVEKIRGEEGSEVALKVEPADGAAGETRVIVIEREQVDMKEELTAGEVFEYQEGDKTVKLGVIRIPQFYFDRDDSSRNVSAHVEQIVNRLKKEGIDGLALDIRGNGGGSLDEVQRMTGFFNGRSSVVQIKRTGGQPESLNAGFRKPLYDGPLVVWTDKGSASASEILAGALQDYNRAVIVGSASTFGKGTVQQPIPIGRYMARFSDRDRAGALKLTIQKYYRPSGSSTQNEGVVPDIHLPALTDVLEVGEAHARHALAHDVIRPADNFKPLPENNLPLAKLAEKSAARLKESKDFQYAREDMARVKQRIEENRISLNMAKRKAETAENEARRKARNLERRERFAKQEELDEKSFTVFRLTLDDLEAEVLPKVNRDEDDERHMRRAKNDLEDLDDTPEWPSGLDASKREGLEVLRDLVRLSVKPEEKP
ncbi:carboxy terminal-processing peptidase [Akkermansiaceae bacterium]|nr:carboxy terminal-processing peptidase [Akkermansiaceae bacterium]